MNPDAKNKQELLKALKEKRLREAAAAAARPAQTSTIQPIADGSRTLSVGQERLWFLEQWNPGNASYNMPIAVRIAGPLDKRVLEDSLREIVRRHHVLRTGVMTQDGVPALVVASEDEFAWRAEDLRGQADGEARAQELAAEEVRTPFLLSDRLMIRALLLQVGDEEHLFVLTLHHIAADGWSLGVLLRELAALYGARVEGRPSPLAELAIQYSDYAAWQREQLESEGMAKHVAYWKQQLQGAPARLELPADRARPLVQTGRGRTLPFTLPKRWIESLEELSKQEGATLFMTLLAAFNVLMSRLSGQQDVVVGTPVANRRLPELEGLIGFFINTLALRTDLSEVSTFRDLLRKVRSTMLNALDHQDMPFEKLVDELKVGRDSSYNPIYQVMLTYNNTPMPTLSFAGLTLEPLRVETETAKADLTMELWESPEGLEGRFEYSTDLFEAETAQRMLGHFQQLLENIIAAPDAAVGELAFLTEAEREELLYRFNILDGTAEADSAGACLHDLFEQQAERHPDAVALVCEDEALTYRELNRRANQLAHFLQARGVGPDSLVGLYLERSIEMIVAILGVLKAGGAYVPLDPSSPQDRVAFIMEDASAVLLLTQTRLLNNLPGQDISLVCIDVPGVLSEQPEHNPEKSAKAEHLAYVIYTSGSTGLPKGVMIEHRQAVRLFTSTEHWYQFDERDVWTVFHSYAFDFSVWEIWGALLYGGKLVVVPYLVSRNPEQFYELLVQEGVTVLNQTPSAFRQLIRVEENRPELAGSLALRYVIFGGEALEFQSLRPWFARHGDAKPQLVNMYGITETTVHVTYRPVSWADLEQGSGSLIGVPIPDLQLYILDDRLQPVPYGVTGEMFVGGAGVARGYLNRPELNEQRYLPNPFRGGGRLYRSGDLARRMPNGDLEYLGRIDNQVKVRGFRIELGEIESQLSQHPDIRECVVLVREDQPGDKRLVAYVVPATGKALTITEMRQFLVQDLPEYMIPALFVTLDQMPLTNNGKVDRKALTGLTLVQSEYGGEYVEPTTPEQQILADVFAQVLNLEKVGIEDNYFALGGDSIRALQVVARAKEQGLVFSLQQLFQHQSVRGLTEALQGDVQAEAAEEEDLPVTEPFYGLEEADLRRLPNGVVDAYPLAALQTGMFFHMEYNEGEATYYNITTLSIRSAFDKGKMEAAVNRVIARHAALRTGFDFSTYREPLQLVYGEASLAIEMEDLRHLGSAEQGERFDQWFSVERTKVFDYARPPLIRIFVHLLADDLFEFSVTECHAILDGWSLTSIFSEIFTLYQALLEEREFAEPETPAVSFRDFVWWERSVLQAPDSRNYWMNKIDGCTPTMIPRLTGGREEKVERSFQRFQTHIPREIQRGLQDLSQRAGVPMKSVLLAAHVKVLSVLGGEGDVQTGVTFNGRAEDRGGDRVRGLFLNTLPFRFQPAGGTWLDLVRSVFANELEMLAHRRYPLAAIQSAFGREPLFETTFNFVHFHALKDVFSDGPMQILDLKELADTNFTLASTFSLIPTTGELLLMLDTNGRVVTPEQGEAMRGYFLKVLRAMAQGADAEHPAFDPLSEAERRQLLVEWNQTAADYPQDVLLHQLVEQQAERTPDATAVVFEKQSLTYAELNRRANQLAHYLRKAGVAADVPVAVFMDRSPEMVVALLGILKAGGAYVPFDPSYPAERLAYMAADTAAPVLLTQEHLHGQFAHPAAAICLDRDWNLVAQESAEPLMTDVTEEQLAYILYTSGSTGQPKGVMIPHRAITNHMLWMQERYPVTAEDKVLQKTPFGFDASVWEFWLPLIAGAQLVMARPGGHQDSAYLVETIREEGITVLQAVPTLLQMLLGEPGVDTCTSLRRVFCGGEVLSVDLQEAFYQQMDASLHNLYGPTETCIDATVWDCAAEGEARTVPIGRPIRNVQIYLLNEAMQPVPVGVPGELHIGGRGLARGYLNRPDLTEKSFVANPFSENGEDPLYKTGDLARYLPNGAIEYMGRIDQQVKMRGFRIELGEIEQVLLTRSEVEQAVALVREDVPGDQRLVAYVVAAEPATLNTQELRVLLQQQLPSYMVPSSFVVLEELPLLPNGKVNRKALPAPEGASEQQSNYAAPATQVEEIVAGIWGDVLRLDRVSVEDNFFDLGGHSLLATQAIARLNRALGVQLPLRILFEAPTVRRLAARISEAQQGTRLPLKPVARGEAMPLSFAQQRLWVIEQLLPGTPLYNMPLAVRLQGQLQTDALERSLSEIVARHEALRTTFIESDGQPFQLIQEPGAVSVHRIDLRDEPLAEREQKMRQLVQAEAEQPFDLMIGPLIRIHLLQLTEAEHVLVLNTHHIVSDGWSLGVLVREFTALYEAFATGRPSPLADLPIQYADYAAWQREWLQGDVLDEQMAYWMEQLGGELPVLQLPTDRPHPMTQSYRGSEEIMLVPQELAQQLQALSRSQGATLFMTLLGAFQLLLAKYSGQEDISVGTPIAGRTQGETEGLIGFFLNTLVMRTDLSGNPTFSQLVERVREVALSAYAHQDVPFEKLVEELQPERDLSRSPLFQVMFVMQNTPPLRAELPELTIQAVEMDLTVSKFDLTLTMEEGEEGLSASWKYRSDLFDRSTIVRMMGHFSNLLAMIAENADLPVADLPLMSHAEQQQMLVEWNETAAEFPTELTMYRWFEQGVESAPDAVAVVCEGKALTYRELNEQANRLAHALREMGVGPEVMVALYLERSVEMIVGMLGILKAGGVMAAFDLKAPQDRLSFLLADTGAQVVLTQRSLQAALPDHQAQTLLMDALPERVAKQSADNPAPQAAPGNAAYVVYTSGSTGTPKGVVVEHQQIVAYAQGIIARTGMRQGESYAMLQPLNVDFGMTMLFPSLLAGGCLHLITEERALEAQQLADYLGNHEIDWLKIAPSHLIALQQSVPMEQLMPQRGLILGGERSRWKWVQAMKAVRPDLLIFNHYGPSETTVGMLTDLVDSDPTAAQHVMTPLGKPLPNTQAYVLDDRLRPVPVGVAGELFIGGRGVARGYLNRPELTEERFLTNPHAKREGERLYRTGDLVRYLPDGKIEFLGRTDDQVKIRGFRVELGEIQAALVAHPSVQESLVLPWEVEDGDQRLVAYVVAQGGGKEIGAQDLHQHLSDRLPNYMVPSAFVLLKELPRTAHGKVDRRALPVPSVAVGTVNRARQAAETPVQEILVGIWEQVLRGRQVGIHDNFFEIGGHSLLATQVISRVNRAFQLAMPLRVLFERPTVAELAACVEQGGQDDANLFTRPIAPARRGEHQPLSFAQQRLWVLDQLLPDRTAYNMTYAVRLTGDLHTAALERAMSEIIRRHDVLRTTFVERDGRPVQVVHDTTALEMQVLDLRTLPEEQREGELERVIGAAAVQPFDLQTGPLLRVTLLRTEEQEHVLVWNIHHIVFDGWSRSLFVKEFVTIYEAYAQGLPSPLSEPAIQYADYAVWQQEQLQGDVLEAQLAYWQQHLSGDLPVLQLPTDRARPLVQTNAGAVEEFRLSAEANEALLTLSQRHGVTLFMTLLAAFQALLARYSGQDDILVGTPIAGRHHRDTEELIGFFVNTLVMRTDLSGAPTFEELLSRVRETALGAYAHQDVPFEKLVEMLQPERDLSRSPLFQVMFILQNTPPSSIELPGLTIQSLERDHHAAKYDLTLTMVEDADGLQGLLEYNVDLFEAATIQRLIGHFTNLLALVVEQPQLPVGELNVLTESERRQLLVEWNQTAADYPQDVLLHQLVEQQAERTPDATAVVFEKQSLTYAELNSRANQLAHYLRKAGVSADVPVAVFMDRSPEMVVALLGVLKAGGAYVPFDPSYPADRLAFMAADTAAPVLLTQEHLQGQFAHPAAAIRLDRDWNLVAQESAEPLVTDVTEEHLAYILYTSGSTGQPKGVMIPHRAIANHMLWMQERYPVAAGDKVLQKTPFGFDASVWEFWLPLVSGAQLVMARPGGHQDSAYLVETIREEEITVLQAVPTLLQMLLSEPGVSECTSLRRVFCGGEVLTADLQEAFYQQLDASLHNLYGPTEACIDTTVWDCAAEGETSTVPIGRPIANVQTYLLDASMQPVPVGVPGELHVGGRGLARGYLNRPDLTEKSFVANPFSENGEDRLYKTGDLARYLPNGAIEYMGRIDQQVKMRGFRIELGEIESVLLSRAEVEQAVALVREDVPGDQRLVAYVVAAESASLSTQDLRMLLQQQLPAYMVPSSFVMLEELPLLPNGKVNRKALPAPEGSTEPRSDYAAPVTQLEEIVAGIWGNVLRLNRISVEDNFFDLGGHSLLATQAISRLNRALGVQLPLRLLFEAPTVRLLAARISEVKQGARKPLLPVVREEAMPLSFAQQRLWVIEQLVPGTSLYNMPLAVRLEGDLNVDALMRSLHEIVARHETLRTAFSETDGRPLQVIREAEEVCLERADLRHLPEPQREEEMKRLLQAAAQLSFDLRVGPLVRFHLLQMADQEHVLMSNMHHIISDGWSLSVLVREFVALYEAFANGGPSPLADLPIQYADYAVWQRDWLQGEVLDEQMAYWKEQLGGLTELQLPTDRPHPLVQSDRGGEVRMHLPRELSQELASYSRRQGATLFMTLLGAFQLLLSRYSGQEDIAVGTPIAGRTQAETEGLIGFFINTLVLRTDLSGAPTFEELLARVRETALGAYAHQDVPFEKLVEELQPERDLSRPPLFQVMFILQNTPSASIELPGLTVRGVEMESQTAKFDLTLSLEEGEDGLRGSIQYKADLFDADTIQRMVDHFANLLALVVEQPQLPAAELNLLTETERRQLLVEWNQTAADFPQDVLLHQLVEQQAERTPDETAVVFENQSLTYAELNSRANQLARYLRKAGVGADVPVAVFMDRSTEMVVALLGILKAGGAYVPFDPSYPAERLAYMAADTASPVLLTQEHLEGQFAHPATAICLDRDWNLVVLESDEPLVTDVAEEQLAYILYTSGSTGQPKGVMIPHRAITNHMLWMQERYPVAAEDKVLQKTPFGFDASVWEFWLPLVSGAQLVMARPGGHQDSAYLVEMIHEEEITVLQAVPTLLQMLLSEPGIAKCTSLRRVFCGGEVLTADLQEAFYQQLGASLHNLYGPTEACIDATVWDCTAEGEARTVPIGRPIANVQTYLLDASMQPVPVGVPGELHIGGRGLARGYLNRPDLTEKSFVANPFSGNGEDRLYKTGDLARYLPNGAIEYMGRIDQQVKMRGFRIELGEIESVLLSRAEVEQAVALVREDVPGDQRLVAYVVAAESASLNTQDLRLHLQKQLPAYMVPSSFVMLEELPLLPNGKVNRKALPAPEGSREHRNAYVPPITPREEIIAGIWGDVLRLDRISVEDNFFELGGHSLLATQVIARLNRALGVQLPLRLLFEAPTVRALAARVSETELAVRPPLLPASRTERIPLSFAQQRLWVLDQLVPGSSLYNMPLAVRLQGDLNVDALMRSLNEIVARHESLRTTFAELDGQPIQVIGDAKAVRLERTDLRHLPEPQREEEMNRLIQSDAELPFDLRVGPLIRFHLLQLADAEHVLMSNMHHIVSDGWSFSVFVREWAALYEAFAAGLPSPLADLPIQYADYAFWQRDWLQGALLDEQTAYWKTQLGGLPELQLPTDRPHPPVQTHRGGEVRLHLPQELVSELASYSRQQGATLFMTLLGAFQLLLSRYSGQEDIAVGTPIAGRTQAETEGLIGFFINTLVLRTDLSGAPTFEELLARVRETALGAYAHQDVPFEKLVEELQPERDLSRSPLFQVMFILQNTPSAALELPGLTIQSVGMDNPAAKYDLTLSLAEGEDGLHGSLQYNADLFDAGTIRRMVGHFVNLLARIAERPQCPASALEFLSEAERLQLLVNFNDTQADYPQDLCIHQHFEEQVRRMPEAVALVAGEERLTYAELNRRANRLAHHLQRQGVGPDRLVGVFMDRTAEIVVALLGILKAGGAYVPLDPTYPQDRVTFTMEDAQMVALLTQSHLTDRLPEHQAYLLCLDAAGEILAQEPEHNPLSNVQARDLGYVIYTSGSTGRPKGVAIEHRNASMLLHWMQDVYSAEELSGVLASTSVCFDLSIYELFGTLAAGGKVILAENALQLPLLPAREEVTLINTVPSAIAELLRMEAIPRSVKTVNLAGEALQLALVQKLYQVETLEHVYNLYGPSEDTTYSTYARMEENLLRAPGIGRPLPNTQAYVLDRQKQLVPIGVAGELYLGGAGLARGYLNREELTAEKFIRNPFRDEPEARLYATGDLVRYLPDGSLDYLGRIDHQVKVRGFRIELGEIENALTQLPDLRAAVVLAREDVPGDKRLVAYAAVEPGATLTAAALRQALQQKLPEYMIPAAFVLLDALPLSPNGKVDRRALPVPEWSQTRDADYAAPSNPTEEIMAGIWGDVLRLESVSVEDNFFDLGGHSLLATQVISRLNRALGVQLPLRLLFEAPTVRLLASRLLEAKQAAHPPLVPMPRAEGIPLSFAQQRLWVLDHLVAGSSLYNMPMAVRLQGDLHVYALVRSLSEIVARHESLRTTFTELDGQPIQVIGDAEAVSLVRTDLRHLPEPQREEEMKRLIQSAARLPFDLRVGPLVRFQLLQLADEEHVLMAAMHHIVSDGWSLSVLVREFASLYEAFANDQPSPLADLPIQYADYAVWQRDWLQGEVLDEQMAYWKEQLGGLTELQLPTDRPHPPMLSERGAEERFHLPQELAQQLMSFSRRQGATLFMTLLGAFQLLLSRYSGQEDIAVGTPIAGRTHAETEGLIGFFINTLVLRTDLSGAPTFEELLARVRETALSAYAHQDVPFEKLVEELQPERDLSRSPLFQVMFILQNTPSASIELPGLTVRGVEMDNQTAKFDLTLSLTEGEDGLHGSIQYKADLFDAVTIQRMVGHFTSLLALVVEQPQLPAAELNLLTEAERRQLLVEWNQTEADFPQDVLLHQLVEQQAERTPDETAVVFEKQSLTYAELNSRANQLAHYLRKAGVSTDVPVAVFMDRSAEMVVALLGILKAGGAYVPFDPSYPAERLAYMAADTAAPVLLTQEHLVGQFAHPATAVCLDRDWSVVAQESAEPLAIEATAESLAYILYTSGSTGQPKGVMIPHRAITNHMLWMQERYPVAAGDKVLQKTPFGFDASVWEFWLPLVSGAQLVMARPGGHQDSAYLVEMIREEEITVLQAVPTLLQMLLSEPGIAKCTSLRRVFCGGEVLTADLQEAFYQQLGASLHNLYGPTEACIDATVWDCTAEGEARTVPIGRPIANVQTYLLDASMQPVPVGVPGELHIGGRGLARGYLNRPDLTEKSFVANPFRENGEDRLYKTGDLARYLPNGAIEYMGRIDQQVKMRGFRIELGEIESAMLSRAEVEQVVALVREDVPGDQRLVAYVVAAESASLSTQDLRLHLQKQLPSYMVPSSFVVLEELPLLPNGKLNRRALPAPQEASGERAAKVPARNAAEWKLVQLYENALGIGGLGVHDDFFQLGGHSLLALRLRAEIEREFGVKVPLHTLFRHSTIEGLANLLRDIGAAQVPSTLVPLTGTDSANANGRTPLFLVHAVGGSVHSYFEIARELGDQAVYGLQAQGLEDDREPLNTVADLASRYVAEMRSVQPDGPYLLGGWSFGGVVAYEMAQQLQAQGEEVAMLMLMDSFAPQAEAGVALDDKSLLLGFGRDLAGQYGQELAAAGEGESEIDSLADLFRRAQQFQILPSAFEQDELARMFAVYKANRLAGQAYQPAPYAGPVTLLTAEEASPELQHEQQFGWKRLAPALDVQTSAGSHFSMVQKPHARQLAELLMRVLP